MHACNALSRGCDNRHRSDLTQHQARLGRRRPDATRCRARLGQHLRPTRSTSPKLCSGGLLRNAGTGGGLLIRGFFSAISAPPPSLSPLSHTFHQGPAQSLFGGGRDALRSSIPLDLDDLLALVVLHGVLHSPALQHGQPGLCATLYLVG